MEQTAATVSPVRKLYPSDLREGEWAILEPWVPAVKLAGRPPRQSRREIANAVLDGVRGGSQWRATPHDLPPCQAASYYFRIWRHDGTWERIHSVIGEQARRRVRRFSTASRTRRAKGGRAATTRAGR